MTTLETIKAERQNVETELQRKLIHIQKLQEEDEVQLKQEDIAVRMLEEAATIHREADTRRRAAKTERSRIARERNIIIQHIRGSRRKITINSEIEKNGFLRFEDFPPEIQIMILELVLPWNATFRLDKSGHAPSLLGISKRISSIATPLFYKSNTIVLPNGFPTYFRTDLRSLVVRIYIRGNLDALLIHDLEKCSNLTHLTLSPDHAPRKIWKRPFQKPSHLSQLVIEDKKDLKHIEKWENFINSTEPRISIRESDRIRGRGNTGAESDKDKKEEGQ